jgi:hypothetical protein
MIIVHDPMAVGREVAQVADLHVQEPALDRTSDDSSRQRLLDHRRKDRDDVYSHHAKVRLKPDTTETRLARNLAHPDSGSVRL